MKFRICSKCKKRPAIVFVKRVDNGNVTDEGYCINCASQMGIDPVNDILKKMGIKTKMFTGDSKNIALKVGEELNLDESVALFEEGMNLSKKCNETLEKAEKKISILLENNGELIEENFVPEE